MIPILATMSTDKISIYPSLYITNLITFSLNIYTTNERFLRESWRDIFNRIKCFQQIIIINIQYLNEA
jgi:hypothetical protein